MIDLKSLISLPYYTTTVPSTGKTVSFRPFVVREEKLILIAKQSDDIHQIHSAIQNVMQNCYKEDINIEEMPYFDIEYLFIQLRMKSMGEIVEIIIKDPKTNEKFDTAMKLENIQVTNLDKLKLNFNIAMNDSFGVSVKYPPITVFSELNDEAEKRTIYKIMAKSIDKIYTKEEVILTKDIPQEEMEIFIDSLTIEMFNKILDFFKDMPKITYKDEFVSPSTGNIIPIVIDKFKDFFH